MNDPLQAAFQLHKSGYLAEAEEKYRLLLASAPEHPRLLHFLGLVRHQRGDFIEAVRLIKDAISLVPTVPNWHANLGAALMASGEYPAAATAFRNAIRLDPTHGNAINNLGVVLKSLGELEEAIATLKTAIHLNPENRIAHSNYLFSITAHELLSPTDTLAEYRAWDLAHGRRESSFAVELWEPKDKLRIGYVSCDLYAHPVSAFITPLLRNHDPSRVEIYCYADVLNPDATTENVKKLVPNWRDIRRLSDQEAAEIVHRDRIDLLVDLGGHTAYNRLGVFAYRPAPVQATYLGYFGPTGMEAIDYWISDNELHPPHTEERTVETIYRLPRCWVAYEPPLVAPSPNQRMLGSPLTFASFNDATKLNEAVLRVWAAILGQCPRSRLHLQAKQFASSSICERIRRQLRDLGIGEHRVGFAGHGSLEDYFQRYHQVDIVLDPFPRTGGTTVADALWMGVPVVTLRGSRYASRIASSKLRGIGLGDWSAQSSEEYIATALQLARAPLLRAELRHTLRDHMRSSSLCDGHSLARAMEEAYFQMWAAKGQQALQSVS
jgi:predicted O-linked N-acetylglucosamine transferase (SPINDLY family)